MRAVVFTICLIGLFGCAGCGGASGTGEGDGTDVGTPASEGDSDSGETEPGTDEAPIVIITIHPQYQNPEPLDTIKLDGRSSFSPLGESRKPFTYQWTWTYNRKPGPASVARLFCDDQSVITGTDVMTYGDDFTPCGLVKTSLTVAGDYTFHLRVKDVKGVVSREDESCPTGCDKILTVKP